MPKMSSIKIVVKIPDSIYPELISDLSRVPLRDRAERIRVLAMLGLKETQRPSPSRGIEHIPERNGSYQEETKIKLTQRLSESL